MKKTKISLMAISALLTLIAVFATSCEKTNVESIDLKSKIEQIKNYKSISNYNNYKITNENNTLKFENLDDFRNCYNDLKKANDSYLKHVNKLFQELTDKQIELLYDEYDLNDDFVYKSFENKYNFQSLRSIIKELEKKYNSVLDQSKLKNPDDHHILDYNLRALLNENCEVIIGNSIFVFLTEEITIEVFNKNYDVLNDLTMKNIKDYEKNSLIKIYGDNLNDSCCNKGACRENISTGWDVHSWWDGGTKYKIEGKIVVVNNAITMSHYIGAKTKTRKWNGRRWKYWNTNILNSIAGEPLYYKNKCGEDIFTYRYKNQIKYDAHYFSMKARSNGVFFSVESGTISSSHSAGGEELDIILRF